MLRRSYPASTLLRPCPTPASGRRPQRRRRGRTLAGRGSPLITRSSLPACRAQYPGGPHECACRCLPHGCCLPRHRGGSASRIEPFEACSGYHSRCGRPVAQPPKAAFARGSSPAGCPARPLASYRTHRHLSGWNLPPLEKRAFRAHPVTVHVFSTLVLAAARAPAEGNELNSSR